MVNDQLLANVKNDGHAGNSFFEVDYPIPQALLDNMKKEELNVKFIAHEGSIAGGIYYIRLLK
jgi:hypothetical protein